MTRLRLRWKANLLNLMLEKKNSEKHRVLVPENVPEQGSNPGFVDYPYSWPKWSFYMSNGLGAMQTSCFIDANLCFFKFGQKKFGWFRVSKPFASVDLVPLDGTFSVPCLGVLSNNKGSFVSPNIPK